MTPPGRPLRFLVAVVGGWAGVRAALLWPTGVLPEVARALLPPASAERAMPFAARMPTAAQMPAGRTRALASWHILAERPPMPVPFAAFRTVQAEAPSPTVQTSSHAEPPPPPPPLPGSDPPPVFRESRWAGSAWAIARPGGRATPFASQLGGSQAGARLAYALDGARRFAVYVRASAALGNRQQEGAMGLDWTPTRAPVHLVVERRIGIAGIGSGTAAGVVGSIGPTAVGAGFRLEGYGQAGVIARDTAEGFADGALRATRTIGPIDLGLGTWAAAQRGAARLDLGPTIGVALPVAGRTLRVTADWRQRLAGDARPGSGPAVSMGMNF